MSKSKPETRKEFIAFCMRKLGEPVIKVNVAPEQVDDCVDQALEYFQRNHYDGSMDIMLPVEITQETLDKGYFKVDDSVLGITNVLEISGMWNSSSPDVIFTQQWQMMAAAARSMNGCIGCSMCGDALTGYVSYLVDNNLMKRLFGGSATIMQWSRHTDRLQLFGTNNNLRVGGIVVVLAKRVLVPDEFPQVWNDPFLKKYATALIKQQWGNNLRKLRNVVLAGGVSIQGEEILQEANEEIAAMEENMQLEWQEPPIPVFG